MTTFIYDPNISTAILEEWLLANQVKVIIREGKSMCRGEAAKALDRTASTTYRHDWHQPCAYGGSIELQCGCQFERVNPTCTVVSFWLRLELSGPGLVKLPTDTLHILSRLEKDSSRLVIIA